MKNLGVFSEVAYLRHAVRHIAVIFCLGVFLAACATQRHSTLPRGQPLATNYATVKPGGLLADAEAALQTRVGADKSGFHLLDVNESGLRWRLALADSAVHTLDLQYYTWWGDDSGNLLSKKIVDAADRGVKVRLIIDDLSTLMISETEPGISDRAFSLLDAHPNIEVRVFNAWSQRTLAGRALEALARMERLNHRMHNKLFIADTRAAIIGGRNIGNDYFGLAKELNFRDLDVLGIGPVARQAAGVFDQFWNSDWVAPLVRISDSVKLAELRREQVAMKRELIAVDSLLRFSVDQKDRERDIRTVLTEMHAGSSRVHNDSPDLEVKAHHMPQAIRALIGTAKREVLITNAYLIPDEKSVGTLKALSDRKVRVRVLTNSLATHDVPAVNSHYKKWRGPLVDAGVELYEARHDAVVRRKVVDTPPTEADHMGLHNKAMVIDRERVFIGSMNLDPRSENINSEMGVIVESAGLATELAAIMDRDVTGDNAWRVTRNAGGSLTWTANGEVRFSQPSRNAMQHVLDLFFMLFPRDLY